MDEHNDRKANMRALFKGQSEKAYIFGKLEKLAHALILLTSQSDRDRPIVERLEMGVLDSVREAAVLSAQPDQSQLIATLLELLSLVRLAGTSGILTQSNASVLVDEYLGVLSRLAVPSLQGIVLSREELLSQSEEEIKEAPGVWQELPSSIDDLFGIHEKPYRDQSDNKGRLVPKITSNHKGQKSAKAQGQTARTHKSLEAPRSQAILSVVKAKGVVSIRDVAEVVTDCSEKTIQRELLALVEKGVLKKEGERRWSTYRLA
jgi:hypothetical protein